MPDKKNINVNLLGGSWMLIQVTLLVLHFGNIISLPLWVAWFPSIIVGSVIIIVLLIMIISVIFSY